MFSGLTAPPFVREKMGGSSINSEMGFQIQYPTVRWVLMFPRSRFRKVAISCSRRSVLRNGEMICLPYASAIPSGAQRPIAWTSPRRTNRYLSSFETPTSDEDTMQQRTYEARPRNPKIWKNLTILQDASPIGTRVYRNCT